MKTILTILLMIFSINCFSQDTIKSIKLDSLIWNKMNQYRSTKNIPHFNVFEDSLMRDFANKVANRNISLFPTKHSSDLGYWSNSECLFTYRAEYTFSWPKIHENLKNNDFEFLADLALEGWINSPTHEHQISRHDIDVSTVVSILIVDIEKQSIRFDSTFEGLSNEPNATFDNTYVYPR